MSEPLSNAERKFILDGFVENERIDGRRCDGFREVRLWVGSEYGSAMVFVGATKVLAQVTYEIVEPKNGRPNVGIVEVNLNMSPMANPNFEEGRLGKRGIELTRLLELTIRESGCVDLESLCLRANIEVFQLNVDITILNDDGSLPDAASIAAVTALSHFRRPDCTVLPDRTIIHPEFHKAMVPLNVYHMPICISFGLVHEQNSIVVDCTEREETCIDGSLIVGVNKRREVCALHQSDNMIVRKALILKCISEAIERASNVADLITIVLNDDKKKRSKREEIEGFASVKDTSGSSCKVICEADVLMAPGVNPETISDEVKLAMEKLDKIPVQKEGDTMLIGKDAVELFGEGNAPGAQRREAQDEDELMEDDFDFDAEADLDDILAATKPKASISSVNGMDVVPPAAMIPAGPKSTPVKPVNPKDVIVIDSDSDGDCQIVDVKAAMKKKKKGKK